MRILVVGAGVIGLTYGYVLSQAHEVRVLVRPERLPEAQQGYRFTLHDLRGRERRTLQFEHCPALVTDARGAYDLVMVAVNRCQLDAVLPMLRGCDGELLMMLNHWDLAAALRPHFAPGRCLIGFPSQVGGGREGRELEVNLYGEGTVLAEENGARTPRLERVWRAFEEAGLAVEGKDDVLGWMKVHYLQQSISAGAILKAGGYEAFAGSRRAVKEMVYAFREGLRVCEAAGVDTRRTFPAPLFRWPAPLVALAMKRMFQEPDTVTMVTGHMKQGLGEWIAGYYEVLEEGKARGVAMPVWEGYREFVEEG